MSGVFVLIAPAPGGVALCSLCLSIAVCIEMCHKKFRLDWWTISWLTADWWGGSLSQIDAPPRWWATATTCGAWSCRCPGGCRRSWRRVAMRPSTSQMAYTCSLFFSDLKSNKNSWFYVFSYWPDIFYDVYCIFLFQSIYMSMTLAFFV